MKIIYTDNGRKVRGLNENESLKAIVTEIETPVSNTGQFTRTTNDVDELVTPATFVDSIFSLIAVKEGVVSSSASITSNTPAVAAIVAGQPTWVSDGIASVAITCEGQELEVNKRIYRTTTQEEFIEITGYTATSLGEHINAEFAARLLGKTPSADTYDIFTPASQGQTVNDLVRNPSLWCADLDCSGIGMTIGKAATAISSRHVISSAHAKPAIGESISFVLNDNSVITRTVTNWTTISYGTTSTDLTVGYLDFALPVGVKLYKTLPANYKSYIPSYDYMMPIINTSHSSNLWGGNRFMKIQEILNLDELPYVERYFRTKGQAVMSNLEYTLWHVPYGLSGEPSFTIVNGELVLLAENHYRYGTIASGGAFIPSLISEVNATMATMHGSAEYQLQTMDLSGFPTIP